MDELLEYVQLLTEYHKLFPYVSIKNKISFLQSTT